MISVNNISMRFGARRLFEDVTCSFLPGRRYAISGPNGAGKSTFMKILTREIEPSKGSSTVADSAMTGVSRQENVRVLFGTVRQPSSKSKKYFPARPSSGGACERLISSYAKK